jgi:hypothetical protein
METLLYHRTSSPAGLLFLAASPKGLVRLEFEARIQKLNPNKFQLQESAPAIAPYLRELSEYFAGHLRDFSFPLDLRWNRLPARLLAGTPKNSLRRNAQLPRHRPRHQAPASLPRRRHG